MNIAEHIKNLGMLDVSGANAYARDVVRSSGVTTLWLSHKTDIPQARLCVWRHGRVQLELTEIEVIFLSFEDS